METESIKLKLDVHVTASSQAGFLSTVIITVDREVEEFIIEENDDHSIKSFGTYPDSSSPDSPIILKLPTFKPNYVYQLLHSKLHDDVLSEQISYKIVEAQLRNQSFDHLPPRQPLFMLVSVKLTRKVYNVVPCCAAPLTTDLDKESEEEESGTCAICLENLLRSEGYSQMPYCSHCFHETCVTEWLKRHKNSCPLCRQPIHK